MSKSYPAMKSQRKWVVVNEDGEPMYAFRVRRDARAFKKGSVMVGAKYHIVRATLMQTTQDIISTKAKGDYDSWLE